MSAGGAGLGATGAADGQLQRPGDGRGGAGRRGQERAGASWAWRGMMENLWVLSEASVGPSERDMEGGVPRAVVWGQLYNTSTEIFWANHFKLPSYQPQVQEKLYSSFPFYLHALYFHGAEIFHQVKTSFFFSRLCCSNLRFYLLRVT